MRSAPDTSAEIGSTTHDARLSITCLGACQVALDGAPVTAFRSQKALALLIYLAVESERPHRRERLAGLFWPESGEQAARHSLRQALANLRQVLRDEAMDRPFLLVTPGAVQFNADSDFRLDLAMVSALFDTNERHPHHRLESCQSCRGRLEQAVALYRGDFLQQLFVSDSVEFEEWATIKREQLQQHVLDGLRQLAAAHEQRQAYEQARQVVWRQLELAPWLEEAHCHLMRLLCLLGQPSAALAQYERCRHALSEALGVEPSKETTTLYEEIRADQTSMAQALSPRLRPAPRHILPAQPNMLVGREAERRALGEIIENPGRRLVTLTGPGGIGKTRLAMEAAFDHSASFVDGMTFVSLAPLTDPALVAPTIAHALGIEERSGQPVLERLQAYLAGKQLLLLLDNFEHVISAATLVAELLRVAPRLEILVTSREVLRVYGEHEFPVPPLAAPPIATNGSGTEPDVIAAYPAVQLFVQRSAAVMPGFQLTHENGSAIAAICARLDGLPLAIELAAVRTKTFSPQALLARLDQSLAWLTGGPRDHPARQQTLRATLDWSYNLLDADEQVLFTRLAVFAGGWTIEAAAAVCQDNGDSLCTLDEITSLVNKSLLQQVQRTDGEPRFMMLETIHEYARDRLDAGGDRELLQHRHAAYFLTLAEAAVPANDMRKHGLWWDRLEAEHANLRAALAWSRTAPDREIGLRLALALVPFWNVRGHFREACGWLTDQVRQPHGDGAAASRALRAKALQWVANFAMFQGDLDVALPSYDESLALFRDLEDQSQITEVLCMMGLLFQLQGAFEQAGAHLEASLALAREIGDVQRIPWCLTFLGMLAYAQGQARRAGKHWNETLIGFRGIGHFPGMAHAYTHLAMVALDLGDVGRAGAYLVESVTLLRDLGEHAMILEVLPVCARLVAEQRRSVGAQTGSVRAARLCGATEALRKTMDIPRIPLYHRDSYQRTVTMLRSHLDEATFESASAEGRAMTLEQAISFALHEAT